MGGNDSKTKYTPLLVHANFTLYWEGKSYKIVSGMGMKSKALELYTPMDKILIFFFDLNQGFGSWKIIGKSFIFSNQLKLKLNYLTKYKVLT